MTTNARLTWRALGDRSSAADLLRELVGFPAERPLALAGEGLAGAAYGERSPERSRC